MKNPLLPLSLCLVFATHLSNAQIINVKKASENAVINKTNQSINNSVNQGVNSIFQAPGKIFKKVKNKDPQKTEKPVQKTTDQTNNTDSKENPTYSSGDATKTVIDPTSKSAKNIDFVAYPKVINTENFSKTPIGDFPEKWITNSSGEIRTVDGQDGNWLQISQNGIYSPEFINSLPDNFTLEYDMIFSKTPSENVHYIFYLYSVKDKVADFKETNYPGNAGLYFAINPYSGEIDIENFENNKVGIVDNHTHSGEVKADQNNIVHVSIWRQKNRIRLYLDDVKVFDLPSAMLAGQKYNAVKFGTFFMNSDDFLLISNLKVATN